MNKAVDNFSGVSEFEIVSRAKQGDKQAVEWVWRKYYRLLVGRIYKFRGYHHLSKEEIEGEALDVLFHKLEIFKPERVRKSPDVWSFSYMLSSGAGHARDRLKTRAKVESKVDPYDDTVTGDDTPLSRIVNRAYDADPTKFEENNPENTVIKTIDGTPEQKARQFLKALTPIQRTVLKLRREGLTLFQVADRMGRSFSSVRNLLTETKQAASSFFGFRYGVRN